jgi:hypothetical protein
VRILLDECLPRELADELVGHEVRTVQQEGWSSLENGALLLRASGTFSDFITIDKNIERTQRHSCQSGGRDASSPNQSHRVAAPACN